MVIKICHHSWDAKVVRGPHNEILKGNYIGALCQGCNLRISNKRVTLPCFAHNATKYDNKFIIKGIKGNFQNGTELSSSILCKDSTNFQQITITRSEDTSKKINFTPPVKGGKISMETKPYSIAFIDSCNFLSAPLDTLVTILRKSNHPFNILKRALEQKYPNKVDDLFQLSKTKGVFPYDFLTGPEKLTDASLPPADQFKNTLTNEDLDEMAPSQEELERRRERAELAWDTVGCETYAII